MSIQALHWVLEESQSEYSERLVLIALANHASTDEAIAFPSVETLARESKLSRRSVQGAIGRLLELGEIVDEGRTKVGTRRFRLPMGGADVARAQNLRGRRKQREGAQISALRGADVAPEPSVTVKEPEEGTSSDFPPSMPDGLRAVAQEVFAVLAPIGDSDRKANPVQLRAVAKAVASFPDRDHLKVAQDCEHYLLFGDGQGKYRDLVRFYRNSLERAKGGKRKPWTGALRRELKRNAA